MTFDDNRGLLPRPPEDPIKDAEKKRKKTLDRYSYLDDIHKTADGKYIYTGPCYGYDETKNKRSKVLLLLWLLSLPALVACVASGCFNVPFMRSTWYTVVPFGFELVSVVSIFWAVCRITSHGDILRQYIRKQTFSTLPLRCALCCIFSAVGLIGGSVFMIRHGTGGQTFRCAAYMALKAVVLTANIIIARFAQGIKWVETQEKV